MTGDAGFFYHIAELETARRYGLKVIVVVNNNTSMNQEAFLWELDSADQDKNWQFHDTDLVADRAGLRLPRGARGRSRRLRRGLGQGPGVRAASGDRRPDRQGGRGPAELRPGPVGGPRRGPRLPQETAGGAVTLMSVRTSMTAGRPAASARSRAGRRSPGLSTRMPSAPMSVATRARSTSL